MDCCTKELLLSLPKLSSPIRLQVPTSDVGSDGSGWSLVAGDFTGATLWTGGRLLASWLGALDDKTADVLLQSRAVLELGCGFFALPTRIAARRGASPCCASDGAGQAVDYMRRQLVGQPEEPMIDAATLDWNGGGTMGAWDVIIFADVIYSESKAFDLASCCARLLRRVDSHEEADVQAQPDVIEESDVQEFAGPCVLGIVSAGRAGCSEFMEAMRDQGFIAHAVSLPDEVVRDAESLWGHFRDRVPHFLCGGAVHGHYYLVRWIRRNGQHHEDTYGLSLEQKFRSWENAENARAPCLHPLVPSHLRPNED